MQLFTLWNNAVFLPRALRISFFLFLITLPFGTKKFLFSFTPRIEEQTSLFIYASDLALLLLLITYCLWCRTQRKLLSHTSLHAPLLIFLAFSWCSLFFTQTL